MESVETEILRLANIITEECLKKTDTSRNYYNSLILSWIPDARQYGNLAENESYQIIPPVIQDIYSNIGSSCSAESLIILKLSTHLQPFTVASMLLIWAEFEDGICQVK